jgi:molybdopterin-guanine dinucleotide biosynthesis protein A
MGTDKASIQFDGERLAARVARTLGEVCDEVLVAAGGDARLAWLGLALVPDALAGAGPLGAIVGGLDRSSNDLVAVVAVDMPFASAALLGLLADRWTPGVDAVVAEDERGPEPLHAIYAKAAASRLRRELDAGRRSVRGALDALAVRTVPRDAWSQADPSGRFAVNLNRPEDVAAADPVRRRSSTQG